MPKSSACLNSCCILLVVNDVLGISTDLLPPSELVPALSTPGTSGVDGTAAVDDTDVFDSIFKPYNT